MSSRSQLLFITFTLVVGMLILSAVIQRSVYAASKNNVRPAIVRPNPDLIVHSVSGHCEQQPNGDWVLKTAVTIKNKTGTPTASEFVTSVGARQVTYKTQKGFRTIGMSFGEHTISAGFKSSETIRFEIPVENNLVSIYYLGATVDQDKQVHEKNEKNNQKVNSGGFTCVK